ncbi:YqaJ viral recombinase family protein [Pseudomonas sp. CCI3.1]|uniref:YqaJ viral recombinase family protein n=1 Tax=Pseudomonas sp. CCI3.1 TaxID=3048618 RepID=UPI002AB3B8BE|nr:MULTISPECIES: YqaJ viral recombinase family protein [unclassified Pseudomonas]MDY7581216.1 YqaJ viral recombinase family protein [Pseudomonas sp. CCI3.1]MEB0068487.1 YqaJ viral recombinase family protein [Pseudomonas sp. CCI3.1]MEB0073037.1 YqaJ viral recombinase family protein [Pseudomonas sp. CCI1.4]
MKVHNVQQGTPEWHALRSSYFTASEAPAMMGASKFQTRNDLLTMKKTGIVPDVTPQQQAAFDRGHTTEEMARPLVEEMIGEELYPIVGTSGNLLASMDGATMLGDVLFEHKLWNEKVVTQIRAGELDPHYYWQLEQQLLVSGAERVIFVCSDGTKDRFAHLEYSPVAGRREQLVAGWAQFEQDLGEFVVKEAKVEAIGAAPDQLPALRIDVTGMVTASNLDAFKSHALAVIGDINTDLSTDKDFADADATVKWCGEVEDKLKAAKEHALSQTESIDVLFKAIDDITAETRRKRLELEKLIKARKDIIRSDMVMDAAKALQAHIDQINETLNSRIRMPRVPADFAGAIKGKRTIDSLKEAADAELTRAKIEASRIADLIRANLKSLNELAIKHGFLFHDAQELVLKTNDDLVALIKVRINEHELQQAELKRQEEEKAQQLAAQQRQKAAEPVVEQPVKAPQEPELVAATPIKTTAAAQQPVDDGQRIKLGDISTRLGFTLSAEFLRSLGFEAVERKQGAQLYRASDFPRICVALVHHIQAVQANQVAA